MKTDEITDNNLFSGFTRAELDRVRALGVVTVLKPGTALTIEGTYSQQAMVILAGTATVERGGELIDTAETGDVIGEIGLLSTYDHRRRATVRAVTELQVIVFSRPEFLTLMNDVPRLAARVGVTAVRRLAADLEVAASSD